MTKASLPPLPDDERVLLLLGLLTTQDRHGYEINDFIEHELGCVIDLKKATAYQLLDRLEQHGLIESRTEQHGARPTRKVYTLSDAGHAHFLRLLSEHLPQEQALILPGNIALMFADHVSAAERQQALMQREEALTARLATYDLFLRSTALTPGIRMAVGRIQALTEADRTWTRQQREYLAAL